MSFVEHTELNRSDAQRKELVGAFPVRGIDHSSNDDADDEEMGRTVIYSMGGRSSRTLMPDAVLFEGQQESSTGGPAVSGSESLEVVPKKSSEKVSNWKTYLCIGIFLLVVGVIGTVYGITCLLYTSPSPRDQRGSRMPSSA